MRVLADGLKGFRAAEVCCKTKSPSVPFGGINVLPVVVNLGYCEVVRRPSWSRKPKLGLKAEAAF